MRREKGVNKSHTRLHLLLENSKQKQAFSPRTKGNVLPARSFSILPFSLQSQGKRGSKKSVIFSSKPRLVWQEHKAGMFLPQCSESLGCRGCVTEVTPSSEGGASHRHRSPSKEGNSTSLTIYRALKQFLWPSPSTWQISGISEECFQPLLSPPGMQGCFMSCSSSTPF